LDKFEEEENENEKYLSDREEKDKENLYLKDRKLIRQKSANFNNKRSIKDDNNSTANINYVINNYFKR